MKKERDVTIDILRGFAVFAMIAANTAGEVLRHPHPFLFRCYGSLAAPLFVFISGMMIFFTSQNKNYGIMHYLKRALMILTIASLLDIFIWKLYPFMIFDVLYIIGVSTPIAYLFTKIKQKWLKFGIIGGIFLVTPILQHIFGYSHDLDTLFIGHKYVLHDYISILPSSFKHFMIDGWFPMFPWMGFFLFGTAMGEIRYSSKNKFNTKLFLYSGIALFTIGVILWYLYPGNMYTRAGYSELFYPVTYGFALTIMGVIILLFNFVDRYPESDLYRPLKTLGGAALFVYVIQDIFLVYVLEPTFEDVGFKTLITIYISFICVLLCLCKMRSYLRANWKPIFAVKTFVNEISYRE